MKTYIVTAKAPDEIYDQRVSAGDEITLTSERAETSVRRGHLVPKPAESVPVVDAPADDVTAEEIELTATDESDAPSGHRPKGRKR